MSKKELTPEQEELLTFFAPVEAPRIARHLKLVFEAAAFESEIASCSDDNGRDALFTVYHLAELVKTIADKNC